MGISVGLEDERGTTIEIVHDPRNLLHGVLPSVQDGSFQWASTIDRFGDTTFNHLQAARLRVEWQRLITSCREPDTAKLLRRIDKLLVRCASGAHLYVKFNGD